MQSRVIVAFFIVLLVVLGVAGQKADTPKPTVTTTPPPKKDGWDQPMKYIGTHTEPPAPGIPKAAIVQPAACNPVICPPTSSCASGVTQFITDPNTGCSSCICQPLNCPPFSEVQCANGITCNGPPGKVNFVWGCSYCVCESIPPTTQAPTKPTTPTPTPAVTVPTTQPPTTSTTTQPSTTKEPTTLPPQKPTPTPAVTVPTTQPPTTSTTTQPSTPGSKPTTQPPTTSTTTQPSTTKEPTTLPPQKPTPTPAVTVPTTQPPATSTTSQPSESTSTHPVLPSSTLPSPSTFEPTTTTVSPTESCPPVDCDAKCPDTTWRLEQCEKTACPKCVCEPPRCPKLDCDASCPGTTWSMVKCEHNDCLECRCDKKTTCSQVDCKAECPTGAYAIYQDEDGCPDCDCNPTCPPCTQSECAKACNGNYKVILGHSGCDECLCQPPCNKPGGCEPCRECECKSTVEVRVDLIRYLTKRTYVPYHVYYDAVTGTSNNVSVVEQYNYVVNLKKSISVYRHALVSLRSVLRKLVLSGRISKQVFDKADEAARRRKAALELDVLKSRLTISELERRLKKVTALIQTLGFERHCPAVCLFIGGRRVCNLHPNYVVTKQATYLKNNIFTKEIYTKVNTNVSQIKKDLTTQTVQYVRRAPTWRKSVVKTHEVVRKAVWDQVFVELLTESSISRYVNRFFELKKEKVDLTKLDVNQTKIVKKILLRRFKRTTVRHIRKALRSDNIKALQLQHKPIVVEPVELPTRVTREIVKLPVEVLRQKEEHIAVLLVGKHSVESH